jgi:hypothetical protein
LKNKNQNKTRKDALFFWLKRATGKKKLLLAMEMFGIMDIIQH